MTAKEFKVLRIGDTVKCINSKGCSTLDCGMEYSIVGFLPISGRICINTKNYWGDYAKKWFKGSRFKALNPKD